MRDAKKRTWWWQIWLNCIVNKCIHPPSSPLTSDQPDNISHQASLCGLSCRNQMVSSTRCHLIFSRAKKHRVKYDYAIDRDKVNDENRNEWFKHDGAEVQTDWIRTYVMRVESYKNLMNFVFLSPKKDKKIRNSTSDGIWQEEIRDGKKKYTLNSHNHTWNPAAVCIGAYSEAMLV